MALSEGYNLTLDFDFGGHLQTFRPVNTFKSGSCKAKKKITKKLRSNSKTTFKKSKNVFLALKIVKIRQNDNVTEAKVPT